jgi:TonB-dependent receptor-like protein
VTLSTLKAVLDTVRIAASLIPDGSGFEKRRRNGMGLYLTAEGIARRTPISTSELFRNLPGVRVDMRSGSLEKWIAMRGARGACSPSLYVDGAHMPTLPEGLTANDIDIWVDPDEIAGIEVYVDFVPPQFQPPLSSCGSIVIWTKRRRFMP